MQYAETARGRQGPTYSFRQDFLVVRIPSPYSASSVDYAETPTPGDVMVNGPRQAFQLIKRRIGMVPKDLLREFADWARAPRE